MTTEVMLILLTVCILILFFCTMFLSHKQSQLGEMYEDLLEENESLKYEKDYLECILAIEREENKHYEDFMRETHVIDLYKESKNDRRNGSKNDNVSDKTI